MGEEGERPFRPRSKTQGFSGADATFSTLSNLTQLYVRVRVRRK